MAIGQELDAPLVPLVHATLGWLQLRHAQPFRSRIGARLVARRGNRPALRADRGGDPAPAAPTITVVPSPSGPPSPPPAVGLEVRPFRALTYRRHHPAQLARVS